MRTSEGLHADIGSDPSARRRRYVRTSEAPRMEIWALLGTLPGSVAAQDANPSVKERQGAVAIG